LFCFGTNSPLQLASKVLALTDEFSSDCLLARMSRRWRFYRSAHKALQNKEKPGGPDMILGLSANSPCTSTTLRAFGGAAFAAMPRVKTSEAAAPASGSKNCVCSSPWFLDYMRWREGGT
jgi:hypothetical protein